MQVSICCKNFNRIQRIYFILYTYHITFELSNCIIGIEGGQCWAVELNYPHLHHSVIFTLIQSVYPLCPSNYGNDIIKPLDLISNAIYRCNNGSNYLLFIIILARLWCILHSHTTFCGNVCLHVIADMCLFIDTYKCPAGHKSEVKHLVWCQNLLLV